MGLQLGNVPNVDCNEQLLAEAGSDTDERGNGNSHGHRGSPPRDHRARIGGLLRTFPAPNPETRVLDRPVRFGLHLPEHARRGLRFDGPNQFQNAIGQDQ